MIRHCTYQYTYESFSVAFGEKQSINYWALYKKCLEESDDTLIWVVTRKQLPGFMRMVQKYDLEKYLIVNHHHPESRIVEDKDEYGDCVTRIFGPEIGITNHNYRGDAMRLKLFVMKGAKA